ncbi:MAG TPA: hypothetical protein VNT75_21730 [Symbiobacteriaceae bacterium]|nr:hypothetical protein [Symbiobacteriaceae bacterium]
MKKLLTVLAVVAAIALLVAAYNFLALRNLRGEQVTVRQPDFAENGVFVQVLAGLEGPGTHWVFIGATSDDIAITIDAPPARGIYYGGKFSSVRHDRPFEVRILRKHLGFVWLPDKTLRFDVPREQLAVFAQADREKLWQAFLGKAKS